LLKEKHKLILDKLSKNFYAALVKGALLNTEINAVAKSQQLSSLPANPGSAQLGLQSSSLPANQGSTQPQPGATSGKKSLLSKLQFWRSNINKGQASLLPSSSPISLQSSELHQINQQEKKGIFSGLGNKARKLFGINKGKASAELTPLPSSPPISLQNPILNTTASSGLLQPVSPLNISKINPSPELLQSVSPSGNPQKLLPSSVSLQSSAPGLLQPEVPLTTSINSKSTSKSSLENTKQSGGKKIQMRTYHFLKHKKYSERAFIAERPIIAADNAYDFMKLHYDIGSKKITFTIHDRVNNKKYKYTARTLKDGTNVIKSAK
jgi:hypothetical protein